MFINRLNPATELRELRYRETIRRKRIWISSSALATKATRVVQEWVPPAEFLKFSS